MFVQADLEIPIPHYFISEPCKEARERKAMLRQMLKKVKVAPSQEENLLKAEKMSLEEAVRVIQAAERARQGRLRAKLNKESRTMNWMYRTEEPGAEAAEAAAICIQKVFKNHPTPTL